MSKQNHHQNQKRKLHPNPQNRNGGTIVKKPAPLRIPVEDEDLEEYEDDGSLYEEELLDDQDDQEEEAPATSEDGVEGVDFVKATIQQEMAGKLFQERQARLAVMQDKANLEQEIAKLRQEVAETRIQRLKDEALAMKNADAQMFVDVGLGVGDQLKPTAKGFIVIPKKS